jgi:hypothetical protein
MPAAACCCLQGLVRQQAGGPTARQLGIPANALCDVGTCLNHYLPDGPAMRAGRGLHRLLEARTDSCLAQQLNLPPVVKVVVLESWQCQGHRHGLLHYLHLLTAGVLDTAGKSCYRS